MLYHFETDSTDFEIIQSLAEEIWPVAYSAILSPVQLRYMLNLFYNKEALHHQHEVQAHRFIIGYNKEQIPCGFASFSKMDGIENRFRLHKLYVLPKEHGKGLGTALIQQITKEIKTESSVFLELNVNRYNTAIQFYQKNGFVIVREEDIEIGNGFFMNDYVMERLY